MPYEFFITAFCLKKDDKTSVWWYTSYYLILPQGGHELKKKIEFDSGKKVFPIIIAVIGAAFMLAMWITRLNMTAVVCVAYCCIVSALIVIGMFFKRRLYLGFVVGYCAALFGIITYYIVFGADAGFGAFTSGLAGFSSAEHPLLTGEGNFFTRLLGNLLLPCRA